MDFAACVLSVGGPLPSYDPILAPPPYTLYTCIQYTYLHRERGEGGGGNQREG
jgi:hypothetical protein